ncbi:MAG: FAD-dependent oxidoreductase [Pseudomonadota bacterium]
MSNDTSQKASTIRETQSETRYDVVVMGAGMTGLTLAYELNRLGLKVCVLEEYETPGGNHISDNIDGMSFDIGAIFHWSNGLLFKMFPGLLSEAVPVRWRTDRINPDGKVRLYPYEIKSELLSKPISEIVRAFASILKNRLFPPKKNSAEAFLHHYLGKDLTQSSGIERYVERFYGLHPRDVSYEFARARMFHIVQGTSVSRRIGHIFSKLFRRQQASPQSRCLARPVQGFPYFYQNAIDQLRSDGVSVKLACKTQNIEKRASGFRVTTTTEQISSDRLFNTTPLTHIAEKVGIDTSAIPTSLQLYSLYFKFKGELGFEGPILYNFQNEGLWKRLTLHSQYYGEVDDWSYFSIETTVHLGDNKDVQACEDDFRTSIRNVDILKGTLELVGHRQTDFAYPLYEHDVTARRQSIIQRLEALGIESAGRQGRFEYLPVTHFAVVSAQDAIERSGVKLNTD